MDYPQIRAVFKVDDVITFKFVVAIHMRQLPQRF